MPKIYAPEDRSDEAHERAVQELLDAFNEGRGAGLLGSSVEMCPDYHTEAERQQWRLGRLQTLGQAIKPHRRAA